MPESRLAPVSAALILVALLAGCAQPQPVATDAPESPAASDPAGPAPKPTAALPASIGPLCFEDFGFTAEQEHHGGDVTWPDPLTADTVGVEPSCWVDELATDRTLFIAGWYDLDDAQYGTVNGPLEDALLGAGYQLTQDTNGITGYELDPGDGQPISVFQLTQSDGYYEVTATFTGRA